MKVGRTTAAITAGLVATLLMSVFMEALPRFGFPRVDVPQIIGETVTGQAAPVLSFGWWLGMAAHIAVGAVVFPFIYVFIVNRTKTTLPPILTGWLFGMSLFLIGEAILIPLTGGGFFSSKDPHAGKIVLTDFLSHSLYGLVLGALTGSRSD